MIVVNMWFIKTSNGLFHYGLDYADALGGDVQEVWVRSDALAAVVAQRLPKARVRVLTLGSFLRAAVGLSRQGGLLFTPSSHPLAFVRRQIVVVHDSFPFAGRAGALKLLLFRAGLALSGGYAAYINRADGQHFLNRCGVPARRQQYLPNKIADPVVAPAQGAFVAGDSVRVGLFGSDSPKKNYQRLFDAYRAQKSGVAVTWRIFGHQNDYIASLQRDFPELTIDLVSSDGCSIGEFIQSIDVAVSVAEGEGFARPVALGLLNRVPTMLLDTPVFREFYARSARMFASTEIVAACLAALQPGDTLERAPLSNADQLRSDFAAGVAWLQTLRGARCA